MQGLVALDMNAVGRSLKVEALERSDTRLHERWPERTVWIQIRSGPQPFTHKKPFSINLPCRCDSLISNIEHIAFMTSILDFIEANVQQFLFVCFLNVEDHQVSERARVRTREVGRQTSRNLKTPQYTPAPPGVEVMRA